MIFFPSGCNFLKKLLDWISRTTGSCLFSAWVSSLSLRAWARRARVQTSPKAFLYWTRDKLEEGSLDKVLRTVWIFFCYAFERKGTSFRRHLFEKEFMCGSSGSRAACRFHEESPRRFDVRWYTSTFERTTNKPYDRKLSGLLLHIKTE